MGCDVYANGMSIACKAADGKTIAAMPDVCLSPPTPPAGPIPLPYPNTAMASDTTKGSKTVQIGGQEVMLKNKSTFKKSTGDEAATKSLGMGVVSHQIQGEVNFCAWSMDVKFEGENVPRHLDLTLHNEMCVPANTPTWPYLDQQVMFSTDPCFQDVLKVQFSCTGDPKKDCPEPTSGYKETDCVKAKRCMLQPYDKTERGKGGCCDEQTGHHLIPKRGFKDFPGYEANKAPCVCAEGTSWHREGKDKTPDLPPGELTHADMHAGQDYLERMAKANPTPGGTVAKPQTYEQARENALATHAAVFSESGCNEACIRKQLDNYHKQPSVGIKDQDLLTSPESGWPGLERITSDPLNQSIISKTIAVLNRVKEEAAAAAEIATSLARP